MKKECLSIKMTLGDWSVEGPGKAWEKMGKSSNIHFLVTDLAYI